MNNENAQGAISDLELDHLLDALHDEQESTNAPRVQASEADVDDILASLGLNDTLAGGNRPVTPRVAAILPPSVRRNTEPNAAAELFRQRIEQEAKAEPEEVTTLELPNIKQYSQMPPSAKQAPVAQAAQPPVQQPVPSETQVQGNQLFGEVDDRFRAFFQNSPKHIDMAATGEIKAPRGGFRKWIGRATRDVDEEYLTGELDDKRKLQGVDPRVPSGRTSPVKLTRVDFGGEGDASAKQSAGTFTGYTIEMSLAGGDGTEEIAAPRRASRKEEAYEAPIYDYAHPADEPGIAAALKNMRVTRILRMTATGLITLCLLYLNISASGGALPKVPQLDPATAPFAFVLTNFLMLSVAALVCLSTLFGGIASLWRKPSGDAFPALATVGALLQTIVLLFLTASFDAAQITLFAPIATFLLFVNTFGKWLQSGVVSKNFEIATTGQEHSAAFMLKSEELSRRVCAGLGEPDPCVLVSRPTGLVRDFMRQSFSAYAGDARSRTLAYVLCGAAVLCAVLTGVLMSSFLQAISAFAAVFCIGAPLASSLVYAVPAQLLQKSASKVGAVVPGASAVEKLGVINTVLLNARDLFPASCVRLQGMKTFDKERIDLSILYATSMISESCDTLRPAFMALVDNKPNVLYKPEHMQTEQGCGFLGWIKNQRVLVGNRSMMERHEVPGLMPLSNEAAYTKDGMFSPVYVSIAGKLSAMFLVSYLPDQQTGEVLSKLEQRNMSVLIQTDDFNLTAPLVCGTYHIAPGRVKVLSRSECDLLHTQTDYVPESEGILTHVGSCSSLVGGLCAAEATAQGERYANLVLLVAVIASIVLCVVLGVAKGLVGLGLIAIVLYQIAWCALTVLIPLLKRA